MQKVRFALILALVGTLVLAACGGGGSADAEGCLGTAADAIVDLDCREVTIAIENAYLPFNYVDAETGEPGGWDYDAWNEICVRLHCTPVYVEAAWEGMIQAVADGQFDAAADGIKIGRASCRERV